MRKSPNPIISLPDVGAISVPLQWSSPDPPRLGSKGRKLPDRLLARATLILSVSLAEPSIQIAHHARTFAALLKGRSGHVTTHPPLVRPFRVSLEAMAAEIPGRRGGTCLTAPPLHPPHPLNSLRGCFAERQGIRCQIPEGLGRMEDGVAGRESREWRYGLRYARAMMHLGVNQDMGLHRPHAI
jgi:hypothetical protein